jgi:hypothetical protein
LAQGVFQRRSGDGQKEAGVNAEGAEKVAFQNKKSP